MLTDDDKPSDESAGETGKPGVTGELPSAPARPVVVRYEPDRPQPRHPR